LRLLQSDPSTKHEVNFHQIVGIKMPGEDKSTTENKIFEAEPAAAANKAQREP
jgi:hypothetical protein